MRIPKNMWPLRADAFVRFWRVDNRRQLFRTFAACMFALSGGQAAAKEPPVPPIPHQIGSPIPVKVVVIANFEAGADLGDAPGEYQFWVEREHLNETIPVRGMIHPVRRNEDGLYGILTGSNGSLINYQNDQLAAFILDPRFDFTKTYWLFTGISGGNPNAVSVGSAAWARWVVSADNMREFDDRDIPQGWDNGLFAIGANAPGERPADPRDFSGISDIRKLDMSLPLNQGLAYWAYDLTKGLTLPDSPALAKDRAVWKGFPAAQEAPHVLVGETLGAWW